MCVSIICEGLGLMVQVSDSCIVAHLVSACGSKDLIFIPVIYRWQGNTGRSTFTFNTNIRKNLSSGKLSTGTVIRSCQNKVPGYVFSFLYFLDNLISHCENLTYEDNALLGSSCMESFIFFMYHQLKAPLK